MKKQHVPFYFLFYIIAVTSGFMAITERDRLIDAMKKEIRQVSGLLADRLVMSMPYDLNILKLLDSKQDTIRIHASAGSLWSTLERIGIEYSVSITGSDTSCHWHRNEEGGIAIDIPVTATNDIRTDILRMSCCVKRAVPDFFSERLLLGDSTVKEILTAQLERKLNHGFVSSDTTTIILRYRLKI